MARRRSYTKPVVMVFTVAVIAGAVVGVYKMLGSDPIEPVEDKKARVVAADLKTPPLELAAVKITPPTGPATQPFHAAPTPPTTKPSDKPADKPADAAAVKPTSADPSAALAEAESKQKADDLVGARKALMVAFNSKKLTPAQHDEVIKKLGEINDVVVFSPRKFLSDDTALQHVVVAGDTAQKIANKYDTTPDLVLRINGISDERKIQIGKSLKIIKGPLHGVVNKTKFTIDIYSGKPGEANAVILKRLSVGLGENDSTPVGEWKIGKKLKNPTYFNPRNDGPRIIEGDDAKNPLGERWLALIGVGGQAMGKESYGIHGTIDPASIGKKMSMGCVRLRNEDVELVYEMLILEKSTVEVVE